VLTYTLSILVNKSATLVVLGAGLVMTGRAVLTPLLQAIAMLAGAETLMGRWRRGPEADPAAESGRDGSP
jgi:H+-transporting ATPase